MTAPIKLDSVDRIVVQLPGVGALVLDTDVYMAALQEGAKLVPAITPQHGRADEPLVDDEQLAALLNIPASWIAQKAREGAIPSYVFGRWRRYCPSEVKGAVRAKPLPEPVPEQFKLFPELE